MELTFETNETGYTIFNDGSAWIVQDGYIPFPRETMEKSAQAHIDDLLKPVETVDPVDNMTIEELKQENYELKMAMAELAEQQTQSNYETNMAIAELAELVIGGVE